MYITKEEVFKALNLTNTILSDEWYIILDKWGVQSSQRGYSSIQVRMHMSYAYRMYLCNTSKCRQPVLEATVQSSYQLLSNLLENMRIVSENSLSGLRAAVSLTLCSAYSLVLHHETRSAAQKLSQAMTKIQADISTWVARQFPSAFQIVSQHQGPNRLEELKVS